MESEPLGKRRYCMFLSYSKILKIRVLAFTVYSFFSLKNKLLGLYVIA